MMRLHFTLWFGLLSLVPGCEQQSSDDTESLHRFTQEYQINALDSVSRFLFIPLSGCDDYIDPLLSHIKSYWQCNEVNESSHLVLSADWPKQLGIMTNYTKETVPSCMVFDSVNVAYFNGLVFNAPVGFEVMKDNGVKKIEQNSEEWSNFLEEYFKIRIVQVN